MALPIDLDLKNFDENFRLKPELWKEEIIAFCKKNNISTDQFHTFKDGSNLVAVVNSQTIIKVFPNFHRHQWNSEFRIMEKIYGRTKIPIPKLFASGDFQENWTYVLMERLPGNTMESLWQNLDLEIKRSILWDIGKTMAQVHSLEPGDLMDLPPRWEDWIIKQRQNAFQRHQKLGMPNWFMEELEDFLKKNEHLLDSLTKRVILTGEYTPFNLLLDPHNPTVLAGMIDFGDGMIGPQQYDYLGPILFLGAGRSNLIQSFFEGYGATLSENLVNILMLLAILHRYSNLRFQIKIENWETRVSNIDDLGRLIFMGEDC